MSSAASQYRPRSPRYVLRADDHTLMRFAGMETRGITMQAQVVDLSETGLSFSIGTQSDAPEEGDMLKVEFTVPGRRQIACFATVVRVQTHSEWDPVLGSRSYRTVALQFRHLPKPHLRALQVGLSEKVIPESSFEWTQIPRSHIVTFWGLALSMCFGLYVIALPVSKWIGTIRSIF